MVILVMADITNKLQINFLAPRSVNWALWKETLREIEYGSRIFIREQPHGRQRKKWDSDECLTSLRHHQSCSAVGQNGWTFVSSPCNHHWMRAALGRTWLWSIWFLAAEVTPEVVECWDLSADCSSSIWGNKSFLKSDLKGESHVYCTQKWHWTFSLHTTLSRSIGES